MDPMASHVTLRRYGIDDGLEIRVPMEDTELLLVRIERVAQVRGATEQNRPRPRRAGFEHKPRTRACAEQPGRAQPIGNHDDKAPEEVLLILDAGARGASNNARKGA